MKFDHSRLWRLIRSKRNVVAYCPTRAHEIRNGREHRNFAFRVFVHPKVTSPQGIAGLEKTGDLLPEDLFGLPVDVVDLMDYLEGLGIVTDKKIAFRTKKKPLTLPLPESS